MSEIRFDSEQELVEGIRQSQPYKDFVLRGLEHKIEREKESWRLVTEHRGRYTREILKQLFDTVDLTPGGRHFGLLLVGQNRKLILDSEPSRINQWFKEVLFSGKEPSESLDACMKQLKIQGASNGLATLLLYLSNPNKWTIWMPATERGLVILGRIDKFRGQDWGNYYTTKFNVQAIDFWRKHGLKPQETDWLLTHISSCVKSEDGHFRVDMNSKGCGGPPPAKPHYWRITLPDQTEASLPNGEKIVLDIWKPCRDHGIAAIGFGNNKEHPQVKKFMSIRPGDFVVAFLRHKTIGGIGKVTRSFDEDLFTQRPAEQDYWRGFFWFHLGVEWRVGQKSVDELPEKVRNKFGQQTIVELSQAEYDAVAKLFDGVGPTPMPALNLILYGPPGTGKTYKLQNYYMNRFTENRVATREQSTQELAEEIKRYEYVTFHQSYSYEDFVEGIKPVMAEDVADTLTYEVKPGIFRTMVKRASDDPNHDYALLIDEINRGNVASIFGELIALIEDDKRKGAPNELRVQLPYSRQEFVVPGNLYIIGAMNTADRSVEALDTALRRRFTFLAMPPQPQLIQQPGNLEVDLRALLVTINARIEKLLDKDHCIGHSYFMGIAQNVDPLDELRKVFATKIMPLLEEYFYGDPAKIGMVLGERFVTRKDETIQWAGGDWGLDDFEERRVYALQDPMTLKVEDFRAVYA